MKLLRLVLSGRLIRGDPRDASIQSVSFDYCDSCRAIHSSNDGGIGADGARSRIADSRLFQGGMVVAMISAS